MHSVYKISVIIQFSIDTLCLVFHINQFTICRIAEYLFTLLQRELKEAIGWRIKINLLITTNSWGRETQTKRVLVVLTSLSGRHHHVGNWVAGKSACL